MRVFGCRAIGRLEFLRRMHLFHSAAKVPRFAVPICCWRCLSFGRDAEAVRIAIIVGKKKLGLAVVSIFEF